MSSIALLSSASFSGDGTPVALGGLGNTPLANFGAVASSALPAAVELMRGRLPSSLALCEKVRKVDQLEKLHLGFDTLEWTVAIADDELAGVLELAELWAAEPEPIIVNDIEVVVSRVGGISHAWRIVTSLGLEIRIPRQAMYRLRVIASPKYILSQDVDDLEERATLLVASLCHLDNLPEMMLSRVDVALDLLMPVVRFENMLERIATRDGSVVRRARLLAPRLEGNSYRSVQVGKSDVVLRIYDKMTEAIKGGDWDLWRKVYGEPNIEDGYTVVRVEFQQRGGFLKQETDGRKPKDEDSEAPLFPDGLRSLAEYRAAAPAVLLYLTQAWFRFAGKKKGADNVRTTLGWWQGISNHFVSGDWYRFVAAVWRDCKRIASKNLDRLMAMSAGCLSAVAAVLSYRSGGEKVGVRSVLDYMFDHLMNEDGGPDKYEKWIAGRDRRYQSLRFGVRI
jgi:hypothetical protein